MASICKKGVSHRWEVDAGAGPMGGGGMTRKPPAYNNVNWQGNECKQ